MPRRVYKLCKLFERENLPRVKQFCFSHFYNEILTMISILLHGTVSIRLTLCYFRVGVLRVVHLKGICCLLGWFVDRHFVHDLCIGVRRRRCLASCSVIRRVCCNSLSYNKRSNSQCMNTYIYVLR